MTVLPLVEDHVAAVAGFLESEGLLVTREDRWPDGAGWQGAPGQSSFVGFYRVMQISGAPPTGGIDGVRSNIYFLVSVQAIGANRLQVDRMRDRASTLLLSGGLTVPGRAFLEPPKSFGPGQSDEDKDENPPVVVGWDWYELPTTPE